MSVIDRLEALDRRLGLDARSEAWGTKPFRVGAIVIVSIVSLIPASAALWNGHHDRRIAAQLDADGVETSAEILDVDRRRRLRAVAGERVKLLPWGCSPPATRGPGGTAQVRTPCDGDEPTAH